MVQWQHSGFWFRQFRFDSGRFNDENTRVMKENKITPFDMETVLMIENMARRDTVVKEGDDVFTVTLKTEGLRKNIVKAIKEAVSGRLGDRLVDTIDNPDSVLFVVGYSSEALPVEIVRQDAPDLSETDIYCHVLEEVRAVTVERDAFERLSKFTGGGTMTIPEEPSGCAVYSFVNEQGVFMNIPEGWWLVREESGRYFQCDAATFLRSYEPKEASVSAPLSVDGIAKRLDALFGVNIVERIGKLSEEYYELGEAFRPVMLGQELTTERREKIIDEMGDVEIVLMHIATLLGTSPEPLIARAWDKIERRIDDPDYMRAHPHREIRNLCEACRWRGYLGTCKKKEPEVPKRIACRSFEKI